MGRKHCEQILRTVIGILLMGSLGALTGCGGGGGGAAAPPPATAPGAFVLSSPTGTGIGLTPTLTWTASAGVSLYTVQVTTSSTFASITTFESTTISTTSVVLSALSPNTTYYWRVVAINSAGSTPSTPASMQFTTMKSGDVAWSRTVDPTVSQPDEIYGVAVDGTAVYAVGYDSNTLNFDDQWRIEKRSLSDGSLVSSFGSAGVITSNPSAATGNINFYDDANAIAIDSGFMYVVGYDTSPDPSPGSATATNDEQWRIEKRSLSTGALSYVVTHNTSSLSDQANAIAVDAARDFMYVAGYDSALAGGFQQWRIEKRTLSSGALVPAFGPANDGVIVSAPSTTTDAKATSIAIEGDNTYMYIGGYSDSATAWRVEKRLLTTGESVTAFGTVGAVVVPSTSAGGQAILSSIKADAQYLYLGGYDTLSTGNRAWRLEKRDKTTGQLVAAFNAGGVVISDPNPAGLDVLKALELDANYIYAAGYDTAAADGKKEWRIEKRNKSDGALVASFATGGVYRNHPSAALVRDDDIWAIAVDADYLYVTGYDMVPGTRQWRIEKIVK